MDHKFELRHKIGDVDHRVLIAVEKGESIGVTSMFDVQITPVSTTSEWEAGRYNHLSQVFQPRPLGKIFAQHNEERKEVARLGSLYLFLPSLRRDSVCDRIGKSYAMNNSMRLRSPQILVPVEEVRAFCERNHIRLFALFGSVLRDDFSDGSDIDVLVEFEPGYVPGFQFFTMQGELSEIFERKVDLNTVNFLSPHMRSKVREEAVTYYDKT